MVIENLTEPIRVNARSNDVFDVFNCRYYEGPNPNLNTAAMVCDFALTGNSEPLPVEEYVAAIGDRYPRLREETYTNIAELFVRTAVEVGKLDIELHFERWSLQQREDEDTFRIALEALHERTSREVIYCVWDWLEAITKHEEFALDEKLKSLQEIFSHSVYGGPTVYALLRTAHDKGIPTFYLWEERLMQYGYGTKQVRGVATTFDGDSHLDSDFTTLKDDCKQFLEQLGFPVPRGDVILSLEEALDTATRIGYPVAVKPVSGHKGIGVTANVQNEAELEEAYEEAVRAILEDEPLRIIVETSIAGQDHRLLCVNGRFVAATKRQPAYVTGDGNATIAQLIERENRLPARSDTPTSPLGKIKTDAAMHSYLREQGLTLESVLEGDRQIYLRKVANLSSGGCSVDATRSIHPDNIILAQDIAQHFRLTCLGIDVITQDLSQSWKNGNFGIIEINAAPGVYMHLKPAIGEPVDVPSRILETFYTLGTDARIPIMTFNRISVAQLHQLTDRILTRYPDWTIGAVCTEGVSVNRSEKVLKRHYNTNVLNLLRNPKLNLLIAEYAEDVLEAEGMFYYGSNLVVLDEPTPTEMMLARDVFDDSTVVIKQENQVTIRRKGLLEQYRLEEGESIEQVYLKEIATIV